MHNFIYTNHGCINFDHVFECKPSRDGYDLITGDGRLFQVSKANWNDFIWDRAKIIPDASQRYQAIDCFVLEDEDGSGYELITDSHDIIGWKHINYKALPVVTGASLEEEPLDFASSLALLYAHDGSVEVLKCGNRYESLQAYQEAVWSVHCDRNDSPPF